MSHEIRTPINTIMGMNNLVLQTELNEDQSRNLTVVHEASDHLLGIINDILDFSKIEAGKLELEHIDFNLRRIVHSALDVVRVQAEQKGLNLQSEIHVEVPDVVQGDPVRLRQVLLNLLSNGVKFTESGSICITVSNVHKNNALNFTVTDTGIGIPRHKQRTIFDGFTQADESMTRRFGGTGLGLSISRQLVELMGGDINLNSTPGRGSTFSFTAVLVPGDPAKVQTDAEATPAASDISPAEPLRVLVAEDNQNNIRLMKAILEKTSHSVQYVGNGREALDALRTASFDIVLMDLEMPEMSGLEAARAIRNGHAGDENIAIPVIALTAHALDEVKRRCFEAGMNGFITKPFKMETLLSALKSSETSTTDQTTSVARSDDPDALPIFDAANFHALFGDDEELCSRIKTAFLSEMPKQIEAIEAALKNRDDKALRAAAHYFKTSVSVISAERSRMLLEKLEEAAQRNDHASAAHLLKKLRYSLEELKKNWT